MTTPGQYSYIKILAQECRSRGIELPEEVNDQIRNAESLADKQASKLIDSLKFELGWGE